MKAITKHLLLFLGSLLPARESDDLIIIHEVDEDDKKINAAMVQARNSFPKFIDQWQARNELFEGFVKVLLEEEPNIGEYMWIKPIKLEDDKYIGILENQPQDMKTLKIGDEVTFTTDQIADWYYVENDKAIGGITVRLLRQRMTKKERDEFDAGYPFSFE